MFTLTGYAYVILALQKNKIHFVTSGEKNSVKINYNYGWACKKYRNKEEIRTQEDYPAAERSW